MTSPDRANLTRIAEIPNPERNARERIPLNPQKVPGTRRLRSDRDAEPFRRNAARTEVSAGASARSPRLVAVLLCEPSSTRSNSQSGDRVSTAITLAPPSLTAPTSPDDYGCLAPAAVTARDFRPWPRPSSRAPTGLHAPCGPRGPLGKRVLCGNRRWLQRRRPSSRCPPFSFWAFPLFFYVTPISSISLCCLQAIFVT